MNRLKQGNQLLSIGVIKDLSSLLNKDLRIGPSRKRRRWGEGRVTWRIIWFMWEII